MIVAWTKATARRTQPADDGRSNDNREEREHSSRDRRRHRKQEPRYEINPKQYLKWRERERQACNKRGRRAKLVGGYRRGEIGGMANFQDACSEENAADDKAYEEGNNMSARPKETSQGQKAATSPPRRPTSVLLPAIVALAAIAAIIVYAVLHANRAVPGSAVATDSPALPPPIKAGAQAPGFALPSKIGTFSSSELDGTPYLLEIFATWCPHCQRMTKVLRAIRASVPQARLGMVSVTGSPYAANSTPDNLVPENQADVDAFESTFGVTWPSFYDPDLTVAKKWGLDGFPTIFIVNAKGTIVYATSGEVSKTELMNAIKKAGA